MASLNFTFPATVWQYDGPAAWYFVSMPVDEADTIADHAAGRTGGFGSVRVNVTIGETSWSTSIFPDTKRGTYVLPVKKAVRAAEDLSDGTAVTVRLEVPLD